MPDGAGEQAVTAKAAELVDLEDAFDLGRRVVVDVDRDADLRARLIARHNQSQTANRCRCNGSHQVLLPVVRIGCCHHFLWQQASLTRGLDEIGHAASFFSISCTGILT